MPAVRAKKDAKSVSPTSCDANPNESTTAENSRSQRKRQSQSCDACRARKVRCVRENLEDPKQSCKHCVALGIPCTYDYRPKKRGPPNLYLRRLQEAAAAAVAAQSEQNNQTNDVVPISPTSANQSLASPIHSSLSPLQQHIQSPSLEPILAPIQTSAPIVPPSRYPIAADSYHNHYSPVNTIIPTSTSGALLPQKTDDNQSYSFSESFGGFPAYNWSYKSHQPLPVLLPSVVPPLSYYYRPHRLEDIAPRDSISLVIALFFDFVYPLTPCIHKPSFMADLHTKREERDPLFFALVMSTVASTLVQVPRSYVPMERSVVRKLAQRCYEASRHITTAAYDPPMSTHVVIRYFDTVYHFCEGNDAAQHAAFGEAAHIAVTLRMHEESSYEGLDPIECEVRRRTFWLLFDADKSMSILLGRPICLRDEDCTVHFPKELDDEYIIHSAYLPQPRGKTALVSGLNYISRIFALLGEILVRIRVDKRSPPQGQFATARLEEVQSLHSRIMGALMHTPEPLRLKQTRRHSRLPAECGGAGFRQATFAEVKDFFENPKASRANALNPFLVMQANLYVTQQLVRFVVEQYRDELVMALQGSIDEHQVAEDREAVASDLLNILHSIPIQSIATNGPSLVHKVRFVASTLLDAVRKAETAPASAARAHAFLWDFLSILSEVERNYLLDDDRDGTSSGEGGMSMI
ncbi:fungal-specific transcription factor domain-containing protein [Suillus subalutaceus]|uniref:fungal-specific transcription factor domain-containing protein n=1 Tax=Suillus subalutaceus TaxID=48586 RepID=UPI001B85F58F|nr:fungal-specific transcription factor domain-containing protein [Suillus subalutaceus]KAG1872355.1 fungal-specific transcription factor domain-containing protein [Suillus subalutaceus]